MNLGSLNTVYAAYGMFVMGHLSDGEDTLVLVGADTGFWDVFTQSAEFKDGMKNPIDRYSKRVIGGMADGAVTHFPSDGPPYDPFITWALKSGRFWQSPTGMMVHDTAGLMISIRGAIRLPRTFAASQALEASPCDSCETRPCVTACPVGALNAVSFYDVPKCKAYLDTPAGGDCMSKGCLARRLCPISIQFDRPDAQSAFHMRAFNPST
ncbi:hypothetical protein ASD8599_03223 [Ascidiaceihabitans donghaensis]|uniref:4Fe-4S ferredoxin-type domain-containing protein n=1 Tax=Ascidiaceihabitans donghaensis TaxID=1510460 RepID=A0A2R8BHD1_9RHOB|nr:ferredoxin [Ascidiaceihabitans donghaensis]SPH22479.1 hypothetical protein ASD8599_03223 [Ascidiaceihabitans donghaensis]